MAKPKVLYEFMVKINNFGFISMAYKSFAAEIFSTLSFFFFISISIYFFYDFIFFFAILLSVLLPCGFIKGKVCWRRRRRRGRIVCVM